MENGTISFVMSIEYQTQNNTNNYVIPLALYTVLYSCAVLIYVSNRSYDYEIQYKKGLKNQVVDAIFRPINAFVVVNFAHLIPD